MTDPKQLTPKQTDTLDGDDLARVVAWWIEGDDLTANTNARIISAVLDLERTSVAVTCPWDASSHRAEWAMELWNRRDQNGWRKLLDHHVASWRAKPRPLTTDYALLMFGEGMPLAATVSGGEVKCLRDWYVPAIFPDGYTMIQAWYSDGRAAPIFKEIVADGPSPTTTIFRAALKVVMSR